jgi:hypothetical protein
MRCVSALVVGQEEKFLYEAIRIYGSQHRVRSPTVREGTMALVADSCDDRQSITARTDAQVEVS